MDSDVLLENLYKIQYSEVDGVNTTWDNVIDAEENWMLNNCPDLYVIEKASSQLQRQIRSVNIDKDIINKIITTSPTPIPETGQGALRIIYSVGDFQHDGDTPRGPSMGLDLSGDYNRKVRALRDNIHKSLVDDQGNNRINNNKTFIMLLSLVFGPNQGGHFALVVGELSAGLIKMAIIDPYNIYVPAFQYIVNDAFDGLQEGYVFNPVNQSFSRDPVRGITSAFSRFRIQFETPIVTAYLESSSRIIEGAPQTPRDVYAVQSYWGQDHFCFMWCTFFAHNFILNRTIDSMRVLYREITENRNINLVIIKTYIIQLYTALGIRMSAFFTDFFKCIWTCYTEKGQGPQPPEDQTLYSPAVIPDFSTYQINFTINPNFLGMGTVSSLNIKSLSRTTIAPLNVVIEKDSNVMTLRCDNTPVTNQVIIDAIQVDTVALRNIVPSNSVFRLVHYYKVSYGDFIDPDILYGRYTDDFGNIIKPDCSREDLLKEEIRQMNLSPLIGKSKKNLCENTHKAIDRRNSIYDTQNKNIVCALGSQRMRLHDYQQKAVEAMIEKSINPSLPGLLVWFGTGTGKTITANTVAKITTVCNRYYRRCFIISTKSVYRGFASSLGDHTDLTPDSLLPNPLNPAQGQDSAYYARHTPSHIYGSGFGTDVYVFSSTRFMGLFMDITTGEIKPEWEQVMRESLFILDEAHKVVNIEHKMQGEYRFYNSCCRAARQVMLMTATPMVNSPSDIEPLLALLDKRLPIRKSEFKQQCVGNIQVFALPEDICTSQIGYTISDVNFRLRTEYVLPPTNVSDQFRNRIIKAMPTGNLPPYRERKLCITTDNRSLISALAAREMVEVDNLTTAIVNSFGIKEISNPEYTKYKIAAIITTIKARENTDRSELVSDIERFAAVLAPREVKFKYVIYSQSLKFLNALKRYMESLGMVGIGEITGDTGDRQSVTQKYNSGKIRILLITDAAVEGVDLRRTGMVILAEPVWTKAKYDQIKGRGVRDSSGMRLKPSDFIIVENMVIEEARKDGADPTETLVALREFANNNAEPILTLRNKYAVALRNMLDFCEIPATIDCMTVILSYSLTTGERTKYSVDTYKYNAMRVKNSEIEFFTENTLDRFLIKTT